MLERAKDAINEGYDYTYYKSWCKDLGLTSMPEKKYLELQSRIVEHYNSYLAGGSKC